MRKIQAGTAENHGKRESIAKGSLIGVKWGKIYASSIENRTFNQQLIAPIRRK